MVPVLLLKILFAWKKNLKKMTQNLRVKPSIFGGLKTRRHVVSHEPSELMFWLLTAVKSNCFTGLRMPDVGQPPKSHTNSSKHGRLNWLIYDRVRELVWCPTIGQFKSTYVKRIFSRKIPLKWNQTVLVPNQYPKNRYQYLAWIGRKSFWKRGKTALACKQALHMGFLLSNS